MHWGLGPQLGDWILTARACLQTNPLLDSYHDDYSEALELPLDQAWLMEITGVCVEAVFCSVFWPLALLPFYLLLLSLSATPFAPPPQWTGALETISKIYFLCHLLSVSLLFTR